MSMTIAIVMATYNGEKYIKEQINSIIKQTRKPDNIILVDDASMDHTVSLANEILENKNIKYKIIQNRSNLGPRNSFFKGVNYVSEDIIFFSDQDDIWNEKKIELMAKKFEENENCAMVLCDSIIFDNRSNNKLNNKLNNKCLHDVLNIDFLKDESGLIDSSWYWRQICYRNIATGMNMAIRCEIARNNVNNNISMLHDAWYAIVASFYGSIYIVDRPLVLYRQHSNNVKGACRSVRLSKIKGSREKVNMGIKNKYERLNIIELMESFHKRFPGEIKQYISEYKKYLDEESTYIRDGKILHLLKLKRSSKYRYYNELDIRDLLVCLMNKLHI